MVLEFSCGVTSVYSEEESKERKDTAVELEPAERPCKLPRISDVDMFSSDIAQQQRASADTDSNCVHSSGEVEIVPPSPLQHSKSSSFLNTSILMGTRTTYAESKQKQNLESYPDDVEPDGSSLSSGSDAVVTEVDCCPEIYSSQHSDKKHCQLIVDEKQKPLGSRSSSDLQNDIHLRDCRSISVVGETHRDDVASVNTSDNVEDLVTQSSIADQSFHSCTTADMDSSSQVKTELALYFNMM